MSKKTYCRCEDITEEDILKAIDEGFDDIESLKRYSGFSTGPCEGKNCIMHVIRLLSQKKGLKPEDLRLTVLRPPVDPVWIDVLAGEE
jgi:NAD(P)H-nitrite reductase large subunit